MTRLEEARELLRQVRNTWPVMDAAARNPYARDWCEHVDRFLAAPPVETGKEGEK